MTWRQITISRILLLIASMIADDPQVRDELRKLSNHITTSVHDAKAQAEADK